MCVCLTSYLSKTDILVRTKKKRPYQPTINIYDNDKVSYSTLECEDYVKYLGILIDRNLNWQVHIDLIGMIAK